VLHRERERAAEPAPLRLALAEPVQDQKISTRSHRGLDQAGCLFEGSGVEPAALRIAAKVLRDAEPPAAGEITNRHVAAATILARLVVLDQAGEPHAIALQPLGNVSEETINLLALKPVVAEARHGEPGRCGSLLDLKPGGWPGIIGRFGVPPGALRHVEVRAPSLIRSGPA
jgi:hypothetical protein